MNEFKPFLKWILNYITTHEKSVELCSNLLLDLKDIQLHDMRSPLLLKLYSETSKLMGGQEDYIEFLISLNLIPSSLKIHIKSLLEAEPLDMIHISIISAFMKHACSSVDLAQVVELLQTFEEFDIDLQYPYDLEDALLTWLNLVWSRKYHNSGEGEVAVIEDYEAVEDLAVVKLVIQSYLPISRDCDEFKDTAKSIGLNVFIENGFPKHREQKRILILDLLVQLFLRVTSLELTFDTSFIGGSNKSGDEAIEELFEVGEAVDEQVDKAEEPEREIPTEEYGNDAIEHAEDLNPIVLEEEFEENADDTEVAVRIEVEPQTTEIPSDLSERPLPYEQELEEQLEESEVETPAIAKPEIPEIVDNLNQELSNDSLELQGTVIQMGSFKKESVNVKSEMDYEIGLTDGTLAQIINQSRELEEASIAIAASREPVQLFNVVVPELDKAKVKKEELVRQNEDLSTTEADLVEIIKNEKLANKKHEDIKVESASVHSQITPRPPRLTRSARNIKPNDEYSSNFHVPVVTKAKTAPAHPGNRQRSSLPARSDKVVEQRFQPRRDQSNVYNLLKKLEDQLEDLTHPNQSQDDGNNNQSDSRGSAGTIVINSSAHSKYFDESESNSESVFEEEDLDSTTSDESDLAVEQTTLNVIQKIRESREAREQENVVSSKDFEVREPLVVEAPALEKKEVPKQAEIVSQPDQQDEMVDSLLDLYELSSSEIVDETTKVERPSTGLQSYPIPENPTTEVIITPKKQIGLGTPKTARRKQKKLQARVEEVKSKKSNLLELKRQQAEKQKELIEQRTKQRLEKKNSQLETCSNQSSTKNVRIVNTVLKSKSNKSIIKNALMHVCLAGSLNKGLKEEVLQDLAASEAHHFIILFRDVNNFSFRGLYFWDSSLDQTLKLYAGCTGPTEIDPRAVLVFYKYDSGARTFKEVPTKSFGKSIDAVAIGREYFVPLG